MGYVPQPPTRLNVDRFGLPRDYATYVWLHYGKVVKDDSPQRLAYVGRLARREDHMHAPPPPQRAATIRLETR